jgi:hypothetical protein
LVSQHKEHDMIHKSASLLAVMLFTAQLAIAQDPKPPEPATGPGEGTKVERPRPPRPEPNADDLWRSEIIFNPDGSSERVTVSVGGQVKLADGTILSREEFDKRRAKKASEFDPTVHRSEVSGRPEGESVPQGQGQRSLPWPVFAFAAVVIVLALFWLGRRASRSN